MDEWETRQASTAPNAALRVTLRSLGRLNALQGDQHRNIALLAVSLLRPQTAKIQRQPACSQFKQTKKGRGFVFHGALTVSGQE